MKLKDILVLLSIVLLTSPFIIVDKITFESKKMEWCQIDINRLNTNVKNHFNQIISDTVNNRPINNWAHFSFSNLENFYNNEFQLGIYLSSVKNNNVEQLISQIHDVIRSKYLKKNFYDISFSELKIIVFQENKQYVYALNQKTNSINLKYIASY